MIVSDTNILSTFARIGELNLLFKLFPQHEIAIPQAVYEEIIEAIRQGVAHFQPALDLVDTGQIHLISLTPAEVLARSTLPESFGPGEAESVAICMRRGAIFLTNDKRARNYCQTNGIKVYDLVLLLRALWRKRILTRKKVQKIVNDIERLKEVVFKNKNDIFR